eukprot:6465494-Amphidinium_carterae.1
MRSGHLYFAELKESHVASGHHWSQILDSTWLKCKRSMLRGRGPPKRAPEILTRHFKGDESLTSWPKDHLINPLVSWSVACNWLLREAEVAALDFEDISVEGSIAKLLIRGSKTDIAQEGVYRARACCGLPRCHRFCPWAAVVQLLRVTRLGQPLFPTRSGYRLSKRAMVDGWRSLLVEGAPVLTGHSARRSGAMALLRRGYSLDAIKFLGRWSSDAVAAYVNEARQHIPIDSVGEGQGPPKEREDLVIPFAAPAGNKLTQVPSTPSAAAAVQDNPVRELASESLKHVSAFSFSSATFVKGHGSRK